MALFIANTEDAGPGLYTGITGSRTATILTDQRHTGDRLKHPMIPHTPGHVTAYPSVVRRSQQAK